MLCCQHPDCKPEPVKASRASLDVQFSSERSLNNQMAHPASIPVAFNSPAQKGCARPCAPFRLQAVKPRLASGASIPGMLATFQNVRVVATARNRFAKQPFDCASLDAASRLGQDPFLFPLWISLILVLSAWFGSSPIIAHKQTCKYISTLLNCRRHAGESLRFLTMIACGCRNGTRLC